MRRQRRTTPHTRSFAAERSERLYCYSAYGLSLAAEQAIPGLLALRGEGTPDVSVRLGLLPPGIYPKDVMQGEPQGVSPYVDAAATPVLRIWKTPNDYYLILFCEGATFAIDRAGTEIWAGWPDKLTLDHVALYLRGPVMGLLMALRGFVCLHASAVVMDGHAVAFAGPAGAGKSTTAAAFVRRGFAALTDDIAAISANGAGFAVQPAFPRLYLWPESAAALGPSVEALPRLFPDNEKRYIELRSGDGSFYGKPAPLGAIYVLRPTLAGSGGPEIEKLAGAEELITLLANHYGSGKPGWDRRAVELAFLGQVARRVPIRRMRVPRGAACAEELCDLILCDLRTSLEEKQGRIRSNASVRPESPGRDA